MSAKSVYSWNPDGQRERKRLGQTLYINEGYFCKCAKKGKKVKDLHGCCRTVSNLGAGQGSRGKSIKIESLTEIVKSNVSKKVRKLLLLNLEINNNINQSITRFEIIWQQ